MSEYFNVAAFLLGVLVGSFGMLLFLFFTGDI